MCYQCEKRVTTANVSENWVVSNKPEINISFHWFLNGKEVNPDDIMFLRIGGGVYTLDNTPLTR